MIVTTHLRFSEWVPETRMRAELHWWLARATQIRPLQASLGLQQERLPEQRLPSPRCCPEESDDNGICAIRISFFFVF
jgi:hypothetical protein